MQAIAQFRQLNQPLLDRLFLAPPESEPGTSPSRRTGVTVTLVEAEDVSGRSAYYDEYGVIRDVMQNHMTQALVYALMQFPGAGEPGVGAGVYGELSHRLNVLNRLRFQPPSVTSETSESAHARSLWVGQYEGYQRDVITDKGLAVTHPDSRLNITNTPTAAVVPLWYLPESGGTSIPVIFKAGKALHRREMMLGVESAGAGSSADVCRLTHHIQGGGFTGIRLEGHCWAQGEAAGAQYPISLPEHWEWKHGDCDPRIRARIRPQTSLDRAPAADTSAAPHCTLTPDASRLRSHGNAYIRVFGALLRNDRSMFIPTDVSVCSFRLM